MRHVALDAEAIRRVLKEWLSESPELATLALVPEAEKDQIPLLQSVCSELAVQLLGGVFPALIRDQKFCSEGVWLMRFTHRVPAFLLPAQVGAETIGESVNALLKNATTVSTRPTLFLLFDAMLPNIASLLEDLYAKLADRVHYVGANVGSETFQSIPCLFNNTEIIADGVLGALLPGDASTVLVHGYAHPEAMLSATATDGNRISMIDWRPAFEVYQELIKAQYGVDLTAENFYQYGVHYPFGILRANLEVVVRMPVALAEDGSIFCVGEVPENAMLVLLKSPVADESGCIGQLAQRLAAENGKLQDRNLLTFYCAGRRMHLGADAELELQSLKRSSGVAEMAGALSLGEIGCTQQDGYPMFHNATLVCTPWEHR